MRKHNQWLAPNHTIMKPEFSPLCSKACDFFFMPWCLYLSCAYCTIHLFIDWLPMYWLHSMCQPVDSKWINLSKRHTSQADCRLCPMTLGFFYRNTFLVNWTGSAYERDTIVYNCVWSATPIPHHQRSSSRCGYCAYPHCPSQLYSKYLHSQDQRGISMAISGRFC